VNYDEAWIPLYGLGQRLSLATGIMVRVNDRPIVRVDLVLYERHAGFTISHAEWAVTGPVEEHQMNFLKWKLKEAELRLYGDPKVARSGAHKSANCASDAPDNDPQRPDAVGSKANQQPLPDA
jgi:hypothetical protein